MHGSARITRPNIPQRIDDVEALVISHGLGAVGRVEDRK
jgi:hypothetical protein